jgi:hypothetical protein
MVLVGIEVAVGVAVAVLDSAPELPFVPSQAKSRSAGARLGTNGSGLDPPGNPPQRAAVA